MRTSLLLSLSIIIILFVTLSNCAKEYSPAGGPKDTLAPEIVKEIPVNNSINFSAKKIKLVFDENIKTDSVSDKIIISPPLKTKPQYRVKGKKLIISNIADSLLKDKTYSITFNSAIKDLNEGNPIEDYIYTFSTGQNKDSLKISGQVLNVLDNSIPKNTFALLYSDTNHLAVTKKNADFIARVDSKGNFTLTNVKNGTYKIVTLKDNNKNYLYDLPTELIDFSDSSITPSVKSIIVVDTIKTKSISVSKDSTGIDVIDSVAKDSIISKTELVYSHNNLKFFLFEEKPNNQFIKSHTRLYDKLFSYKFNLPIINDSIKISPVGYTNDSPKLKYEILSTKDSLLVWLLDSTLYKNDSLKMVVSYYSETDSGLFKINDTLKSKLVKYKKDSDKNINCSFIATTELSGNVDFMKPIQFEVNTPIDSISYDKFQFFETSDTLSIKGFRGNFYKLDSLKNEIIDSISISNEKKYLQTEAYDKQKITQSKLGNGRFALYFSLPIEKNNIKNIYLLKYPKINNWYVSEIDVQSNSLTALITDKTVSKIINPAIIVSYLSDQILVADTIFFNDEKLTKSRNIASISKPELFIEKQQIDALFLDECMTIYCNNFIKNIDTSLIKMQLSDDTTNKKQKIEIIKSKKSERIFYIKHQWAKSQNYRLIIEKGAITDVYENATKESIIEFKTQKPDKNKNTNRFPLISNKTVAQQDFLNLKLSLNPANNTNLI
ncbi:MAG: Ig-like domain-containing protein [Bacteroidales bacterium]|nr:Ig-like domain-containing protein [Bacteroidales bacterium]